MRRNLSCNPRRDRRLVGGLARCEKLAKFSMFRGGQARALNVAGLLIFDASKLVFSKIIIFILLNDYDLSIV
jgi:hypothetical protein